MESREPDPTELEGVVLKYNDRLCQVIKSTYAHSCHEPPQLFYTLVIKFLDTNEVYSTTDWHDVQSSFVYESLTSADPSEIVEFIQQKIDTRRQL